MFLLQCPTANTETPHQGSLHTVAQGGWSSLLPDPRRRCLGRSLQSTHPAWSNKPSTPYHSEAPIECPVPSWAYQPGLALGIRSKVLCALQSHPCSSLGQPQCVKQQPPSHRSFHLYATCAQPSPFLNSGCGTAQTL